MKKYSVFNLWVIKSGDKKFICERICDNAFREIFTKQIIKISESKYIESLTEYYSPLEILKYNKNLEVVGVLMLEQKELLTMYIELNRNIKQEKLEEPQTKKEKAIKTLQNAGILDKDGNLIGPYKEIFIKNTNAKTVDMWQEYVEEQKEEMPNIPIINAKELNKQKNLKAKN